MVKETKIHFRWQRDKGLENKGRGIERDREKEREIESGRQRDSRVRQIHKNREATNTARQRDRYIEIDTQRDRERVSE